MDYNQARGMYKSKITYSKKDTEINNQIYQSFLNMNLDDGWTEDSKTANFQEFTKIVEFTHVPLADASILDVGCGTGDLASFLQNYSLSEFVGIDVFENSIIKANEKFPHYLFILSDFLRYEFDKKYDYVVCSGALTTKLSSNNYDVFCEWVKKMWELCTIGVYFNVLIQQYPGQNGGSLFLYDRRKVLEICAQNLVDAQMKIVMTDTGSGDFVHELHVYLYH